MLVLSRQRDQAVVIDLSACTDAQLIELRDRAAAGQPIEVTNVDIRGDKVRLGINAPRSVIVHRREVYDEVRRERARAAEGTPPTTGRVGYLATFSPGDRVRAFGRTFRVIIPELRGMATLRDVTTGQDEKFNAWNNQAELVAAAAIPKAVPA